MQILETERLILRQQTPDDAPFLLQLMNEPSWLQFIGDRGVRSVDGARAYILNGAVKMYERYGFGLYLTELKSDGTPIGICGLIKRDTLDDIDIGFAFMPAYWSKGYAYESASAILQHAHTELKLERVVAITSLANESSIRLLKKLGFQFEGFITSTGETELLNLFALDLSHA